MKLNKILGVLVATTGVIASIGVASALYVTGATDTSFNIGATYHEEEGAITYKINGKTSGSITPEYCKADGTNHGTGLGGEYTQIHYSIPLSATFGEGIPAQNFVVGNFSVSITNINAGLVNNSKIWMNPTGYVADSVGQEMYGNKFMTSDTSVTESTWSINKDIVVSASGAQSIDLWFKVTDMTALNILNLDEAAPFDISISWGSPANYEYAYIVGGGTMWNEDDAYRMVPNINKASSEGFEWMFSNLPGSMGTAKAKKGDTWSSGDNAELDSTKTYTVYWNGSSSSQAYFVANA